MHIPKEWIHCTENVIEANKAKSGAVLLNGAAMFEEN